MLRQTIHNNLRRHNDLRKHNNLMTPLKRALNMMGFNDTITGFKKNSPIIVNDTNAVQYVILCRKEPYGFRVWT